MAKRLTNDQKEKIIDSFKKGESIDDLSKLYKCTKPTIIRNLKKTFGDKKFKELISKVTVVHILLCTTTSIGPAYAINLKYITPKKPHQKDPRLVSIIPLLKLFMINIY